MNAEKYYLLKANSQNQPVWNNQMGDSADGLNTTVIKKGMSFDFVRANDEFVFTPNEVELFNVLHKKSSTHWSAEVKIDTGIGLYTRLHVLSDPVDLRDVLHGLSINLFRELIANNIFIIDPSIRAFLIAVHEYWTRHGTQEGLLMPFWSMIIETLDYDFYYLTQSGEKKIIGYELFSDVEEFLDLNFKKLIVERKTDDNVIVLNKNEIKLLLTRIVTAFLTFMPSAASAALLMDIFILGDLGVLSGIALDFVLLLRSLTGDRNNAKEFWNEIKTVKQNVIFELSVVGMGLCQIRKKITDVELSRFFKQGRNQQLLHPLLREIVAGLPPD